MPDFGSWGLQIAEIYVIMFTISCIFSSPELKAQVSYSGRPSVCKLLNFNFFSRTTGPILTKLGTNHPWGEGILIVQMKGIALLQGEIITKE
jgi:hypothetical protein